MALIAESDIAVYTIAGMTYLVLVAMIYLLIQSKSRKLAQKMVKEALEKKSNAPEAGSNVKMAKIGKKAVDEIIFFIGFGISIAGLAVKSYTFLITGITVSIFSVFLLHLMLVEEDKKKALNEKLSIAGAAAAKEERKEEESGEADKIAKFLHIADEMLEKVPENEISGFAASDEFEIYKRIVSDPPDAVNDDLRKLAPVIDGMLGKLPKNDIRKFTSSRDFRIYEEMMGRLA